MKFPAYPSSSKEGGMVTFQAFLQAYGLLHKSDNIIIPITLLIISVGMVMYQHLTNINTGDTSTRNFLVLIFLSILPLAFLEKKLMACKDPLGMISKFSTKVLMMHASFLLMRFVSSMVFDYSSRWFRLRSRASLAVVCLILPEIFGLRFSRKSVWEHRDVLLLTGIAILTAICTEWIGAYMKGVFNHTWLPKESLGTFAFYILTTSSDYIEILSFAPAMWMVCQESKSAQVKEVNVAETQKRALTLFTFILTFYTCEDLHNAITIGMAFPMAAAGHMTHFLLLLDFSVYVLAHLYDPSKCEKLLNNIWNLIAGSSSV